MILGEEELVSFKVWSLVAQGLSSGQPQTHEYIMGSANWTQWVIKNKRKEDKKWETVVMWGMGLGGGRGTIKA